MYDNLMYDNTQVFKVKHSFNFDAFIRNSVEYTY